MISITQMRDEANSLVSLKSDVEKRVKEFIKYGSEALLAEYPEIIVISWKQYAPSFNDGDPCYFSITDVELNEDLEEYEDYDEDDEEEFGSFKDPLDEMPKEAYKKLRADVDLFQSVLEKYTGELESLYGHARFNITRKGIEVSEYDCGF